ncbi:MAG: efflux transporter outer membrane subunit [Planctomycetota bacterium]|nr:MAG: efflux transporter outer membrane subunit [Planctomycetota bacterium]
MNSRMIIQLLSITALIVLTGCMVGPDYERPQTTADTAAGYVYAGDYPKDCIDIDTIDRWWERFADPVTTELVNQALNNNNDLQAAAARVLQAQALLAETRGQQLPDISYNFTRSRNKTSFNFGGGRFSNLSTTFSQDLTVSYIMDLFGKLKRAERAAWADLLAAKANGQALLNAVISSVVKARADIATIQRSLAIARADTANWQRNLEIIERRYSRGLVGPLDVRMARENLEASKAAEILVELALIKARNALDVLLGRQPGSSEELPQTLAELPDLTPVPVGVPALLLDRRPDVRAAELALESSSEQIGISIAQLYPDLTLTGTYGRSADTFEDLFIDDTEIYGAIFRLAQPIFRGGQLRARVDAAKAKYEELASNYAQTVLTALREVEDALVREQLLQRRLNAVQLRFNEATAAEKLAGQRYLRGVERLITVLETERRRRIAENQLNNLKGELWAARVDLFLSLGGDWVADPQQTNYQGRFYD